MGSLEKFRNKRSGCGFHTFEVDSYSVFLDEIIQIFRDTSDFIWRGSRDPDWHLISSLTRRLQAKQQGLDYNQWMRESSYLTAKQIRNYLMELRGVEELSSDHLSLLEFLNDKLCNSKQTFWHVLNQLKEGQQNLIFELFAKGQHHELGTPLLDWSRSPAIALFFAFEKSDARIDDEGCRVVYALNRTIVEKKCPPGDAFNGNDIRFIESLALRNPRIVGQAGLFTFSPSHISIEKWAIENYTDQAHLPVLIRFLIRNKSRKDCLAHLEKMNVHARSLYPDLIGAARAANYSLEKD